MIESLGEKPTVVARKTHLCQLCGLDIPKGATHYTQRCADGSSVWTWRAHTRCRSLENEYWAWCGIELRHVEYYDEIPSDEFRQFLATEPMTTETEITIAAVRMLATYRADDGRRFHPDDTLAMIVTLIDNRHPDLDEGLAAAITTVEMEIRE